MQTLRVCLFKKKEKKKKTSCRRVAPLLGFAAAEQTCYYERNLDVFISWVYSASFEKLIKMNIFGKKIFPNKSFSTSIKWAFPFLLIEFQIFSECAGIVGVKRNLWFDKIWNFHLLVSVLNTRAWAWRVLSDGLMILFFAQVNREN